MVKDSVALATEELDTKLALLVEMISYKYNVRIETDVSFFNGLINVRVKESE